MFGSEPGFKKGRPCESNRRYGTNNLPGVVTALASGHDPAGITHRQQAILRRAGHHELERRRRHLCRLILPATIPDSLISRASDDPAFFAAVSLQSTSASRLACRGAVVFPPPRPPRSWGGLN